jgi:hypothetical protein
MDQITAKQIIKEAINVAISRGCFGLIEVKNIVSALEYLDSQPDIEFKEVEKVEA